jgi:hypothetical protein
MPVFGKKENCPTSHEILAFSLGEVADERIGAIRWHLTFCDFCAAELQLLSAFAPKEEPAEDAGPIPFHLRELADSILNTKELRLIDHTEPDGGVH